MSDKTQNSVKSPVIAKFLLELFLRSELKEQRLGDYEEVFQYTVETEGIFKAKLWYWSQTLRSIPKLIYDSIYWGMTMFSNYLKIAFRNIRKYKGYSFINIFGLALGLTCALFIFIWVQDELSYDTYNEKAENIYRLEQDQNYSGRIFHIAVTPTPVAPALKDEIPEVVNSARLKKTSLLLSYNNKKFYESEVVGIDSTYLEMFTLNFLSGDKSSALDNPNSIIISQKIAQKYFGSDKEVVGKTITVNNEYDLVVSGVFEDFPPNVSYRFDAAFRFKFFQKLGIWDNRWSFNSIRTFVELVPGVNLNAVNTKVTNLVWENNPDTKNKFMAVPLLDIHLYSQSGFGDSSTLIQSVYIFSAIGVFILLIASINFMNLATARSAKRAKEIGLRKVTGALRNSLLMQFFGESILLAFIGLFIAFLVVIILLGSFNEFTDKEILLGHLLSPSIVIGALLITITTGILAGIYPALYLSNLQPVIVLKGEVTKSKKSALFRKFLVVIQFSLSVFFIIGTIIVYNQMVYMKGKDLGFDKEHVVYFNLRGDLKKNYQSLKSELEKTSGVLSATGCSETPNIIGSNSGKVDWDGKDPNQEVLIGAGIVDYYYAKTMGIKILDGHDFLPEYSSNEASETAGFLVNEEVVKAMGLDNNSAVGARFDFMGVKGTIVGVMKNFHFGSVKNKIEPIAFVLAPNYVSYLTVRLASGNVSEKLSKLESAWKNVAPNYPFEYQFLDEDFNEMYQSEERMVGLLRIFTLVAIAIACLGLFGLASFMAEQKTKEVGIRKVLGASEIKIVYLLSKEFVILVLVSSIIAWPIAYLVLNNWLQDFAYRINISFWSFLFAGFTALLIAILTVSYQSIKAALANPIDSIKYE